jgi:hypothetical protein
VGTCISRKLGSAGGGIRELQAQIIRDVDINQAMLEGHTSGASQIIVGAPMTFEEARRDVEMLLRLKAGIDRKRDSILTLFTSIYSVALKWRKEADPLSKLRADIAKERGIKDGRLKKRTLRLLLAILYPKDSKLASRYSNALRYALLKKCAPNNLAAFIRQNGGIEACDRKYRAHMRKRLKRTSG